MMNLMVRKSHSTVEEIARTVTPYILNHISICKYKQVCLDLFIELCYFKNSISFLLLFMCMIQLISLLCSILSFSFVLYITTKAREKYFITVNQSELLLCLTRQNVLDLALRALRPRYGIL